MDVSAFTRDKILAIPPDWPEKLFPSELADAKAQYRRLAAKWHPDRDGGDTKVMAHIQVLFSAAEKRIIDGTWRVHGLLRFRDLKGADFTLRYKKSRAFELGQMYYGDHVVAWALELKYEDLLRSALSVIEQLGFANADMRKEHGRYLPEVLSVTHAPDKFVVVMRKMADQYLLRDVLEHFGGRLEDRHVAWIVSSLLNLNCYLNWAGIVHHAFAPDTWFISPDNHSGALLGGWWYAVRAGQKVRALPTRTLNYGPRDLGAQKLSRRDTDSAMIRATGRELLGDISGSRLIMDKRAPKPMINWLLRPGRQDAFAEYDRWYNTILKQAFGSRRFVRMALSSSDFYKE